jgi:hypothetical protein
MIRPQDYHELPANRHAVAAGSILLPTDREIAGAGGSSLDFVTQQGGNASTFIFVLGVRQARGPEETIVEFVEGIFLSDAGSGFRPTWGVDQLLNEIDLGGWKVVPTGEMLERWATTVEERMNRGSPA